MDYSFNDFRLGPLLPPSHFDGDEDQHKMFEQPKYPTHAGGAGRPLSRQAAGIYAPRLRSFGQFTTPHEVNRGGRVLYQMYYRTDVGSWAHKELLRTMSKEYELHKFNSLVHPQPMAQNHPCAHAGARQPDEQCIRLLDMINYPAIPDGLFNSVYSMSGEPTLPEATQPKVMTEVFKTAEIAQMIMVLLYPRKGDLDNLSRSCQFMMRVIHNTPARLDIAATSFKGLEDMKKAHGNIVMVSPFRKPYESTPSSIEGRRYEYGYPMHEGGVHSSVPFETSIANHVRLYKSLGAHRLNIEHLMLIACPLLDIGAVTMIVEGCPRLKVLGIHNCMLLNYGHAEELINIYARANARGRHGLLSLDFTPCYYPGPKHPAPERKFPREFGIVPEDEGRIDPINGIVANLVHIFQLCQDNGAEIAAAQVAERIARLAAEIQGIEYVEPEKAPLRLQDIHAETTAQFNRRRTKFQQRLKALIAQAQHLENQQVPRYKKELANAQEQLKVLDWAEHNTYGQNLKMVRSQRDRKRGEIEGLYSMLGISQIQLPEGETLATSWQERIQEYKASAVRLQRSGPRFILNEDTSRTQMFGQSGATADELAKAWGTSETPGWGDDATVGWNASASSDTDTPADPSTADVRPGSILPSPPTQESDTNQARPNYDAGHGDSAASSSGAKMTGAMATVTIHDHAADHERASDETVLLHYIVQHLLHLMPPHYQYIVKVDDPTTHGKLRPRVRAGYDGSMADEEVYLDYIMHRGSDIPPHIRHLKQEGRREALMGHIRYRFEHKKGMGS
ncbi:hypothetical protein F5Y15DRAFT_429482 [Xylariaceae sp. FL0016]|nr:hypothetical protein F5Y15DRAFT_429482 [Xylariaceae sp. FL0016]